MGLGIEERFRELADKNHKAYMEGYKAGKKQAQEHIDALTKSLAEVCEDHVNAEKELARLKILLEKNGIGWSQ